MIAAAAAAVFVGAALQSATGFGFALVAAPLLFAVLGPQQAVTAGVLLGLELNLMTLAGEGRRPRVLPGTLALVAWSVPGLALGALALRELPDHVLSVLVALAVLAALAVRLRGRGRRVRAPAPAPAPRPWQVALAGASSGALATSTSLSGPPLVFHLLARGAAPEQMRDTLAAIFVALSLLGTPALLATGTWKLPDTIALLVAVGAAGQLLGRRAFARLVDERYEAAVLVVLAATAIVALAATAL